METFGSNSLPLVSYLRGRERGCKLSPGFGLPEFHGDAATADTESFNAQQQAPAAPWKPSLGGTDDSSASRSPPSTTSSENRRCCLGNKRISQCAHSLPGRDKPGTSTPSSLKASRRSAVSEYSSSIASCRLGNLSPALMNMPRKYGSA